MELSELIDVERDTRKLFNRIDWDDVPNWSLDPQKMDQIVALVGCKHTELAELGFFALREGGNRSPELFDKVAESIRASGADRGNHFSSLMLYLNAWSESYCDFILDGFLGYSLFARINYILALARSPSERIEDFCKYLGAQIVPKVDSAQIIEHYMSFLGSGSWEVQCHWKRDEIDRHPFDAERVFRAVYISSVLKTANISELRRTIPCEDSFVFDGLARLREDFLN